MSEKKVFIFACETSGDMHGAALMRELKKLCPAEFHGMGGVAMREAGFRGEYRAEDLSVMGFTEVFEKLPFILRLFWRIRKDLKRVRPDAVILIDSPDFNFHVARMAKSLGICVIYHVSPQVWAWRSGRVRTLKKNTDALISILPFEKEFYAQRGMDIHYVGHPLLDVIRPQELDHIAPEPMQVGILPGSRGGEIRALMPVFSRAAEIIKEKIPEAKFGLVVAPGRSEEEIRAYCASDVPMRPVNADERYAFMKSCRTLIAASGTVALEAALIGVPAVIAYKLSALTFFLAKRVVNVNNISLPNLILGRTVYPELLQEDANPETIADLTLKWLENESSRQDAVSALLRLRELCGPPGAVGRAAAVVAGLLRCG